MDKICSNPCVDHYYKSADHLLFFFKDYQLLRTGKTIECRIYRKPKPSFPITVILLFLQDEIRKERHELKNKYFYIQTLVHEKKFEQLEDYLNHAIGKKLSSFEEIQTGNTLMDYILNQKIQTCRKNNIKVFSEILIPEQLNISEDTLCTILLNLLDNAITASLHEPDADIHISIRCVQKYLVCKIKNKCSYNVLEQNPNLATTKQDINTSRILV